MACHALNSIHGTLKLALLFYTNISEDQFEQGFTINPYEICVCNKIINGDQITVFWHVGDIKISRKSAREVSMIIEDFKANY